VTPRAGISGWCVRHPIATALLTLASLLLGLLAFLRLGVAPLPEADFPTIQINALLPGGSPETMASSVATPLEVQFSAIPGITEMTSSSALGTTTLTLQFSLDKSIDVAAQEVQAAINAAAGRLPVDMPNLPTWRKVNPADSPIMILRVNSEMMPLIELSDYAETILARQLSQVNGVGQIFVVGQQRPAIRIQAQPEKLAAYQLTLADLRQSLQSASVNLAKGALYGEGRVSTLAANDQLFNASDYDDLVVAYRQGAPVFLKDVARIVSAPEDDYVQAWPNGVPGVALVILRQPGANIVDTADAIQAALPRLREMLPATIEVDVLNDRTRTIRSSLHEVELTLLLTIGLVVLVMGLFLRQLSATLIVATVLAVSLSASFAAMYVLGFTLNNLTLVALIIAVGFIVDDAIVVVENIHRHLEAGASKVEAALKGAAEIGFTVISISFSLIAAFIPLLFMGGIVGRLFREFAVSVTVAILISVVASLTLAPMLASRFMPALRHAEAPRKGFAEWLTGGYERGLRWALGHQRLMLVGFAFTVLVAVAGYVGIPKGFFPLQDTAFVFGTSQAAEDISYDDMVAKHRQLAEIIASDPAVQSYNHAVGVTGGSQSLANGRFWIVLKDRGERDVSVGEFIDRLRPQLAKVPGIMLYLRAAQDINLSSGPSRTQYQYALRSSDSTQLALWAQRLTERLKQVPGLMDVSNDLQVGASVTALDIDRVAAARFGLSAEDVSQTLYDAFGQRQVGEYQTEVNQYKVVLELDARQRGRARRAPGRCRSTTTAWRGAGLPELAGLATAADPRRADRGVHHPRRALREFRTSADDPLDPALGGDRRGVPALGLGPGLLDHGADRHRAADRHRQEERHPHGRLRHRRPARAGHERGAGDLPGLPDPFPADHDDHPGRAAGRDTPDDRLRHRFRAAPASGHRGGRRAAGEPGADPVQHAGGIPGPGAAVPPARDDDLGRRNRWGDGDMRRNGRGFPGRRRVARMQAGMRPARDAKANRGSGDRCGY